jgi:hypothetical protein
MDNNKHVIIEIIESVHSSKGALVKEGDWNENTRENALPPQGHVTIDMM